LSAAGRHDRTGHQTFNRYCAGYSGDCHRIIRIRAFQPDGGTFDRQKAGIQALSFFADRAKVLKQLIKLEKNPDYGNPLGNKAGINLEGCFKLYADDKRIRIIYELIDNIIKVIAIDKREDMEVYRIALKRIQTTNQG
jgi:mRNA interferase RelE/StbE